MIRGITIHNSNSELSARELLDLMKAQKKTNLCHYLVDEKEAIQVLSERESASHTGRGYDFGNRYTLAIEICRSRCDDKTYIKAEKNAVKLIKKLMKKYDLSISDIYFHIDFNPNYRCPHRILDRFTKEEFINEYFIQS